MRWTFCIPGMLAAALLGAGWRPHSDVSPTDQAVAAEEPGDPMPGLTRAEEDLHIRGRRLFRWELWRPDRNANGFNQTECSKCHLEPMFGGSSKEPSSRVAFIPDETDISGWKTFHRMQRNENRRFVESTPPVGSEFRRAPSLYGAGLFEAVPQTTFEQLSDPTDKNNDGISGRFLMINKEAGRFGWRGSVRSLETFVLTAFKGELGIVVEPYEREDFAGLGYGQIKAVSFYVRTVSPPKSKQTSKHVPALKTFEKIGCVSCHVPTLTTGPSSIKPLAYKSFNAYTDLLLHDMSDSADIHREPKVPVDGEYRTAPLWGLGDFGGPYWHDGSAKTLHDAILKHGGEAKVARAKYEALNEKEQRSLIELIESL